MRLIGPLLAFLIYYQLDISTALLRASDLPLQSIVFASILCILTVVIRGIRWYILIWRLSQNVSFLRVIAAQFIGAAMGAITPGKLGEFFKIAYIKVPHTSSTGRLLLSAFIERFFDLAGLLCFGLAAIGLIILDHHSATTEMTNTLMIVVCASAVTFFGWAHRSRLIDFFIMTCRIFNLKLFVEWLSRVSAYLNEIRLSDFFLLMIITFFSWLTYLITFAIIVSGLGINLDFFILSACAMFAALISALPISISGIGTREAALIYAFSMFGIISIDAVAVALILLALNLIVCICGIIFMLYCSRES